MSTPDDRGQLYALKFSATGEVRDADGNLLNQDAHAESTITVTEQEARAILERNQP